MTEDIDAFFNQVKNIEWESYFISMLFEEFRDGELTVKSLQFGRDLVADKAIA